MGFLGIMLLVLFVAVCVLLIFFVIIQDQEGDSIGGIFGGAGNTAFGSRSTNIVVKITYVLGSLFMVLAFALALLNRTRIGDVEAAARKKGATTGSEWYNTESSSTQAAPALQGTEPAVTTPQDAPLPATDTTAKP